MTVQRITELLSGSADGVLDNAERVELDRYLAESETARGLKASADRFEALLDATASLDPPDELHARILEQISLPARRTLSGGFGLLRGFVHYGIAAAAGVLLAVAFYESRTGDSGFDDFNSMVGTMAPDVDRSERLVLDSYAFSIDGVSSSATLERRHGRLVIDVRFDAAETLNVSVTLPAEQFQFDAFAQLDSDFQRIAYENNAIRVKGRGRKRFAALLQSSTDAAKGRDATIELEFSSGDSVVRQGSLVLHNDEE